MKLAILTKSHPKERGQDAHGSGAYLAPRGSHKHHGIDMCCSKGSYVLSVSAGRVTKIGFPYSQARAGKDLSEWEAKKHNIKKSMRYVQVTDHNGYDVRYFYIEPLVKLGDRIEEDDILGQSQGLSKAYPAITDHFHFEVKKDGEYVNPHEYLNVIG